MGEAEYQASRRIVFQGLAGLGIAAALAGCGSKDNVGGTTPAADGSSSAGGSSGGSKAGAELAKVTEIPVGGGIVLADANVVLTQPTAGQIDAYSATCTHQGFMVTSVEGDTINCNHHGSQYDAKTGGVVRGPAPVGLKKVAVVVKDGAVLTA